MADDQNGKNGAHSNPARFRIPDKSGRPIWVTEDEQRAWIEEGNRMLDRLAEMTDETDTETEALWDEVLRTFGGDPTTGQGLGS